MKKIYLLLLLPVVAVVMLSCGGRNRDAAIAVGNKYMDAFMTMDILEMAKYCTPEIADGFLLSYMADTMGYVSNVQEGFMKNVECYTLDKNKTEIERNKAEIVYRVGSKCNKTMRDMIELDMAKIDGVWVIKDIDTDYAE